MTNDYEGAAARLGDTVKVVLQSYHEIHQQKAHERVSQFLTVALK